VTPREFLRTLIKGYPVILISLAVALAIAALLVLTQDTAYRAAANVRVDVELPDDASEKALEAAAVYADYKTVTVKALVTSEPVLEAVIEEENLDLDAHELATHVAAISAPQTNLIEIRVTWSDAQGAADIANSIAQQVVDDFSAGGQPVSVEVSQVIHATPANSPAVPSPTVSFGLAAFAALWFSAGWLFIRRVRESRASESVE